MWQDRVSRTRSPAAAEVSGPVGRKRQEDAHGGHLQLGGGSGRGAGKGICRGTQDPESMVCPARRWKGQGGHRDVRLAGPRQNGLDP